MISDFFHNKILICALGAWLAAQAIKTIIYAIINRSFDWHRLFGDGGMPSGHSATVCALATSAGVVYGLSSFAFAISAIVAVVVMHDAMGVRHETGKQARVLNEMADILKSLSARPELMEEKLKELVGHTPLQVTMGGCLGVIIALWICL